MAHSIWARLRPRKLIALALIGASLASGCRVLPTIMYVAGMDRVKAEYEGLEGKVVAVVCRPPATLQYRNATAARDIAKQVGVLLSQNVKKIKVVEARKVFEWTDENDWEEYTDIGKAVNADVVVGIDLETFSLYVDQTLMQGKAAVRITVFDMAKDGEEVFERVLPHILYPPNNPVPSSDEPEEVFRRNFVTVMSEQIVRYFYDHDPAIDLQMSP